MSNNNNTNSKRSPDIETLQQQITEEDEEDEDEIEENEIIIKEPLLNNNNINNNNNNDYGDEKNYKISKTTISKQSLSNSSSNYNSDSNNSSEIFVNLNPHNEKISNNIILNNSMSHSYDSNIIYKTEGPFNERIPIMVKNPASPNLPFTFFRGLWVIILVVVFLFLSTIYFIEYRFLDTNEQTGTDKRNTVHYLFIITRPLVLVPLLFIIPLYGLNDKKTRKYSVFIAIALVLNIIGDCIYSIQINLQSAINGNYTPNSDHSTDSSGGNTDANNSGSQSKQQVLFNELLFLFSFIFYLLSRLLYTLAFIIGIGKKIKPRLFHAIPFYVYAAALIMLIVFSKSIAPYMHRNNFNPLPNLNSFYQIDKNNVHYYNNNNNGDSGNNDITTSLKSSSASDSTSTSSSELEDMNPVHFLLICCYGFIESTMVWRALSLTSSFPGTNPSRMLLWFCVLGATTFGIVDTLLVIDNYYHPIQPIFYLSNALNWLAASLIVFSIPRRLEIRDYIYKVFRLNRRGFRIISNSMAFNNKIVQTTSNINS